MRAVIVCLLLVFFASSPARATPCQIPPFYDGFSGQFFATPTYAPTTASGFIYGLDETYLYVPLVNRNTESFINVPQAVAQQWLYSSNSDTFYLTQIYGQYRRPLLTEKCINILVSPTLFLLIG